MFLKVIGDPIEAQKKLGSNLPLKEGQLISGNEANIKILAQANPELFACVDASGVDYREAMKPKHNKLAPKQKYRW